jgi:hypothetical protein
MISIEQNLAPECSNKPTRFWKFYETVTFIKNNSWFCVQHPLNSYVKKKTSWYLVSGL